MVQQPCEGKPPAVLKSAATRRPEKGRGGRKRTKMLLSANVNFFFSLSFSFFDFQARSSRRRKNSHKNSALCHKCQFSRYKGINKLPKRSSQMVLSIRTLFFAIVKIFSCAKASSAKCMNQCDKRK